MSFRDAVEALERKYGGLNAASRKADIPTGTLFSIKRGADPRASTLAKIAHGLDKSLPEFYAEYGDGEASH